MSFKSSTLTSWVGFWILSLGWDGLKENTNVLSRESRSTGLELEFEKSHWYLFTYFLIVEVFSFKKCPSLAMCSPSSLVDRSQKNPVTGIHSVLPKLSTLLTMVVILICELPVPYLFGISYCRCWRNRNLDVFTVGKDKQALRKSIGVTSSLLNFNAIDGFQRF